MLSALEHERLIRTRRDLHRHPELGFQEFRTAGIVAERLRAAGFQVREGVAETGVIGSMRGGAGTGRTLLIRADMDALPIQEECTHDYISTVPGKMHACGHDAHVAIGLAVAERLAAARAEWNGEVRCLFQPAEEGGGGARRMIQEGAATGVDAAIGLHVWLGLPSGTVGVVPGPLMAASREFAVTIRGRGGHAAIPQETIDATVVASHVVVSLQSIVARNVSPLESAVVTVGSLQSGSAPNAIADRAVLGGTLRAFQPEVFESLLERVEQIVAGVCSAFGAEYEVSFGERYYPPTVNDEEITDLVRREAEQVVGEDRVLTGDSVRTMAAEDFSEFLEKVPGCYFFLGARNDSVGAMHPHHSPHFNICEEALPLGVVLLERVARGYLSSDAAPLP